VATCLLQSLAEGFLVDTGLQRLFPAITAVFRAPVGEVDERSGGGGIGGESQAGAGPGEMLGVLDQAGANWVSLDIGHRTPEVGRVHRR